MLKNKSIYFRLIVQYLLVIFFLSFFILVFSCSIMKNQTIESLSKDLRNNCVILRESIEQDMQQENREKIQEIINQLGNNLEIRITIINTNGLVLADNSEDYKAMDNHIDRPEVKAALAYGYGHSLRYSATLKKDLLYVAVPVENAGKTIGFIRMSIPVVQITSAVAYLMVQIILVSVILFFVSVFVVHKMSLRFSEPIHDISLASQKVAAGDFSIRLFNTDDTEIKDLVKNFNYMTEKLAELFSQVVSEKEQAESIISSVSEGIVVISTDGIITEINQSFLAIFDCRSSIKGRFYWEVLRNGDLVKLIKTSGREKKNSVVELDYAGKTLICSANYISSKNEKVLLVSDITKLKNLEKLKKDFVANVSHELRTPLTAIKGFIETLMELHQQDSDELHYLEIIARHTERMINIVNDLLMLSELEEKGSFLAVEEIDLANMAATIGKIFTEKLTTKGLDFKINCDEVPKIYGDAFKLEQIFINLIDNAIKYTDHGLIQITIKQENQEYVEIHFSDTGIGINLTAAGYERLFERFYVVDKSRSRKTGGTGLGLSIVKHIVLLHKGQIRVKSRPGTGTTFIVTLPIDFRSIEQIRPHSLS